MLISYLQEILKCLGPALCLFLKTFMPNLENLADRCWRAELLNKWLLAGKSFPIGQTFWECKLLKRGFLNKKCAIFSPRIYAPSNEPVCTFFCVLSLILKVEKLLGWTISSLTASFVWLGSCDVTAWTSMWGTSIKKKKKWYKWTYLQNRNRVRDVENKLMVTMGERGKWGKAG